MTIPSISIKIQPNHGRIERNLNSRNSLSREFHQVQETKEFSPKEDDPKPKEIIGNWTSEDRKNANMREKQQATFDAVTNMNTKLRNLGIIRYIILQFSIDFK